MRQTAIPSIFCLLISGLAGCYTVAGRPYEDVSTIGVKVFVNRTLYRDLDFLLTDAINREVSALAGYQRTSPGRADAVIEGELTVYREAPEIIDEDQRAVIQRLAGTATARLIDNHTGEILAGPVVVTWTEIHRERGTQTIEEARALVMKKLAQEVVTRLFMPWPAE